MQARLPVYAPILPTEIWQSIMLLDTRVYCALSITCRAFKVDKLTATRAFIRTVWVADRTETLLPNGQRYSVDDQPTIIYRSYGCAAYTWYLDGYLHRGGGLPAHVNMYDPNTWAWFEHGQRHRDGGLPAVITSGKYEWYTRGRLHREDDLPAIVRSDEYEWYKHGSISRDHGPMWIVNSIGYRYVDGIGAAIVKYTPAEMDEMRRIYMLDAVLDIPALSIAIPNKLHDGPD